MTEITEMRVGRADMTATEVSRRPAPALEEGQVLVAVERFSLTANNVSYALTGDMLGYWGFFPAPEGWGHVPVWGFGEVVASRCPDVPVGDRLFGYFTTASHVVLQPKDVTAGALTDAAPHRAQFSAFYNGYRRVGGDPPALTGLEDERCIYHPLFMTAFLIADHIEASDRWGATQAVIGSASSKTALGLAKLLTRGATPMKIIGVTSPGNRAFTEGLGCYDQVIDYGAVEQTPVAPTVYVDMSGNRALTTQLHHHLGAEMKQSIGVGATHWRGGGPPEATDDLPGAKPGFFFAPTQAEQRAAEWGADTLMSRAYDALISLTTETKGQIEISHLSGADAVSRAWGDLLENRVAPSQALMAKV